MFDYLLATYISSEEIDIKDIDNLYLNFYTSNLITANYDSMYNDNFYKMLLNLKTGDISMIEDFDKTNYFIRNWKT